MDLVIAKETVINKIEEDYDGQEFILYPYEKGIAQFVMIEVPVFEEGEISLEELQSIESERGTGALGSSTK